MPFKIPVVDQLGENVLHKGGNRAGIKAQLLLIDLYKMLGKHHIADAKGGGNGFGERVQIDHVIVFGEGEQGFGRLGGDRKLGFKIVFNNISRSFTCPTNVLVPFGCRRRNTAGIASVGGGMDHACLGRQKGKELSPQK